MDLTDSMLSRARRRVARWAWSNVELVQEDAARFSFPEGLGGILSIFALTLVPEYESVIRRGTAALAAGGRWALLDLKLPTTWAGRLLPVLLPLFRPFGVSADLAQRYPWESLARYLPGAGVRESYLGYVYLAVGGKRNAPMAPPG